MISTPDAIRTRPHAGPKMTPRPAIRHIVFFSAKEKSDIPAIVAGLKMLADIPHSHFFEVRENIQNDALSGEVDVIVYAEFESVEKLTAYKADPIYQESIRVVRPLRDMRIAADF